MFTLKVFKFKQNNFKIVFKVLIVCVALNMIILLPFPPSVFSGSKNISQLKDNLPPGERYYLLGKRDPFIPLNKGEKINSNSLPKIFKKKNKFKKTQNSFGDLPLLPMKIFLKIREGDPVMFDKLKRYADIFNKKKLGKMDSLKFNSTVSKYRNIIRRAQNISNRISTTAIQVDFKKLHYSGFINRDNESIALIQKSSGNGYTAKIGSIIGPNFGVIKSIGMDEIIVIERYRNYLGEFISMNKNIPFKQSIQTRNPIKKLNSNEVDIKLLKDKYKFNPSTDRGMQTATTKQLRD
tara:strand:- start:26 stop:907 length:882 start_codon:yes stop_codon:yes gene_type:complete